MKLFSKRGILTRGRRPLYAATRVFNASSATASSAIAKCWIHTTNKTNTFKNGLRKAYYSTGTSGSDPNTGPELGSALPLYQKVINAWNETPVKWYPIPIAVGALVLVAVQYRRKARKEVHVDEDGHDIVRLKGPWQVHVLGALPLRNMSRLWGYVNSLELPVWFRPYGFKLYAATFGCDLDEIEPADLKAYASLGEFFYRKLKEGSRPVEDAVLVSPADGKILHFGTIQDWRIEQVKGITYSLDALLGVERPGSPIATPADMPKGLPVVDDHEFANVNGIEYSLHGLIGGSSGVNTPTEDASVPHKFGKQIDASVVGKPAETLIHDVSVASEVGLRPTLERKSTSVSSLRPGNTLFFSVIYLAPGDYHRFHSPAAWVVEKRRHFVGELFSVSPYIAKRLENLFVLNERVALLGRWKHGFFSMVPVGATNVGSIKVNFDQTLRTNLRGKAPPPGTYTEAVYSAASSLLNGQPLLPAQEMGGFCLGSTIVLVFEAPRDFQFAVQTGQKVKVGQKLGDIVENKTQ
ncbi:unnamed protein product [Mycena citricolor]|uniref:Phosphatidylserine decarboxylase proenzyme 1, mitochondrial n=1 Tax=Mycena citricolor TaxID=2018698 RepID=A0AAD2GRJ5_9AGAR|nr:unnamed protein product [Mycena citricolor]